MKKVKRKKFYENVKFKDKESKKYLCKAIFHFAAQHDLRKFEYITNHVSHAVPMSLGKHFKVVYPVTISGTSISKLQLEDSKGNIFELSLLPPNKIIFYEKHENSADLFISNLSPADTERRFYAQRICYHVENV